MDGDMVADAFGESDAGEGDIEGDSVGDIVDDEDIGVHNEAPSRLL